MSTVALPNDECGDITGTTTGASVGGAVWATAFAGTTARPTAATSHLFEPSSDEIRTALRSSSSSGAAARILRERSTVQPNPRERAPAKYAPGLRRVRFEDPGSQSESPIVPVQ